MAAAVPRPEYPRPQFQRERWLCLNGTWDFAFGDEAPGTARRAFDRTIMVPFAYQSRLSGIGDRTVQPVVWYRRSFAVPHEWKGSRLLLHFGAVDYGSEVWLNGERLGCHEGGYTPASFEVTHSVRAGDNLLVVRCEDLPSDEQPFGKQDREGHQPYRFAATTGIWQTVWLEPVSDSYLESCRIEADLAAPGFRLTPQVSGPSVGLRLAVRAFFEGREVGRAELAPEAVRDLVRVSESHPWSDERPHLYDLELVLRHGERELDRVRAYAGLREIRIEGRRILLNGRPLYQRQVLDQGYWPDGVYTAPSDEALRADVEWIRRMGFNGVRKHQKVEDPRWLHWCDRLGVLVWHEMAAFGIDTPLSRQRLRREWQEAVRRDLNHPSIVAWVPFNESMGIRDLAANPDTQAFVAAVAADTRALDHRSRPVVDNSGWEHVETDIADSHNYDPAGSIFAESWSRFHEGPGPERGTFLRSWSGSYGGREWYGPQYPRRLFVPGREYAGQPIAISEWGGFFLEGKGTVAPILRKRRGVEPDERAFLARYQDMIAAFDATPDLAGDCWTQLTDIEDEPNGLLTGDRRPKVDVDRIAEINRRRRHG